MEPSTDTTLSVSGLTSLIKETLDGAFPALWVSGELSNLSQPSSGHLYFTLKDESAEIRCAMFKGMNQFLRFKPENGMQILLNGKLTVYENRGTYQLIAKRMEPAGLGTLYLAFEALKKSLTEKGWFDIDLKIPIPVYSETIGIVTSKTGAALQDMLKILLRRAPYLNIIVKHARVQGIGAAESIAEGIRALDASNLTDVLIVGRGGGSLEDLWAFNEESVAKAVYECTTPIISAVGHETDATICDMVADLRAPTPSTAAEVVARSSDEIFQKLGMISADMNRSIGNRLRICWQDLDRVNNRQSIVDPKVQLSQKIQWVDSITHQLSRLSQEWFTLSMSKLNGRMQELHALNPEGILERGYAIAMTVPGNKILKHPNELKDNERFEVRLAGGRMAAQKTGKKTS
ncbi:MAG: exodeoxyribonuclease VII large subunit [Candidatus Marinimicrobia bacterium]|nr:exodeoxyribonuclease VII large subunit [Candidatus Neomarinimicrobiota bacterium]MBT3618513.1 exodeoxyribonuclease VII large subunit [Candidatus Neomarinimicrobiota bacterium]MBT3828919.1 exodeoxyribonuclease VII large subunit [Candidatus Neomarinimicrobiota bacterium]MBT3997303.1 exodeoxyribonuclease VII large subunit [Candidatus Neomarinimicrobiota bacterium]MBT4281175.1 exodeoxyribonuclease VII large subunit [Candidatus Neomarinimicrobiota bacterium]